MVDVLPYHTLSVVPRLSSSTNAVDQYLSVLLPSFENLFYQQQGVLTVRRKYSLVISNTSELIAHKTPSCQQGLAFLVALHTL